MAVLNQRMVCEFQSVWERALIEMADGIVDVLPLTSGFARDVHGRLIFTERLGSKGWKCSNTNGKVTNAETGNREIQTRSINPISKSHFSTTTVNYCCDDSGVRAIRLRV